MEFSDKTDERLIDRLAQTRGNADDPLLGQPQQLHFLIRAPTLDAARAATTKGLASAVPLGRFGSSEEIAAGIVWLASEESAYMTGSELVIDGGKTIA